jgi:hypothetical protein
VEICFPDEERQKLFSNCRKLRTKFGDALAEVICSRLGVLKRASSLGDVPQSAPFDLARVEDQQATFSVSLPEGKRLFFEALAPEDVTLTEISLSKIRYVQVLGVEDAFNGSERE